MSLLRANADSEYGRRHGFASIRDYQDFVSQVPITTYADISDLVERAKAGDVRAMFGRGQRIRMFAMTSGTVDKPKYVPVTDRFLADTRQGWHAFAGKALTDHPDAFARPLLQVTSPMDEERSTGGYPCGAITGLMAANQMRLVRKYYAAPLPVAHIPDSLARRYTIMRLAMPQDVSWMVTASPATVLQLARTGEAHAESIIRDVLDGTLSKEMPVPENVRKALKPCLRASPDAARRLERLYRRNGRLRPMDYWNLSFLANWTGGTMGLYLREYPEYFGDTPVRDIGLIATEGRMSIPIENDTPAGIATVSTVFFEFVPVAEHDRADPLTLRTHEVMVGAEYFLLLTNSAGLYRYDISDCVRVVGFKGQAPLIEFLHKGAHVGSVIGEKITERQVVLAFEKASGEDPWAVSDFVLAPRWADPPFYRLYVDSPSGAPADWVRRLALEVDRHLAELNIEYASKRSSGRLGGVEGCVVQAGTLQSLDRERASRFRSSNEQFKHQYLYTSPGQDRVLAGRALQEAVELAKADE